MTPSERFLSPSPANASLRIASSRETSERRLATVKSQASVSEPRATLAFLSALKIRL